MPHGPKVGLREAPNRVHMPLRELARLPLQETRNQALLAQEAQKRVLPGAPRKTLKKRCNGFVILCG